MADLHKRASLHHPQHAKIHQQANSVPFGTKPHPSIPGVMVPAHHRVEIKNKLLKLVSPNTSVSADLLDRGRLDFRIERGTIDLFTHAFVKVSVTNDTGAGCTLAPSQFMIDRIEVYSQNGNQLLTTLYGQELWLANAFLNDFEFSYLSTLLNTNATYSTAGVVLASTASQDLYIPIMGVLATANLHLSALRGELLIRVTFNPSTLTHVAGSLLNTDNCQLLLKGYGEPSHVKQQRVQLYNTKAFVIPVINWQRHTQTLTLAASSAYTVTLNSLKGISAGMFLTMRAAAITAANQGTYLLQFDQLDIQESDGQSMLGNYKRTNGERLLEYTEIFHNKFGSNSNFIFIPFSEDPVHDVQSGDNLGSHVFTGFEKLSFTTLSTLAGASYIIDIYSLMHEHLTITGGDLTISRN